MFGGFSAQDDVEQKKIIAQLNNEETVSKKRKANESIETLEKELNDSPNLKQAKVDTNEESDLEDEDDDFSNEQKMIAKLEELTKVKEVENSTLKMGYNEEDYEIRRAEYPNCIHDYIAPRGYVRKEKFVKPKELDK